MKPEQWPQIEEVYHAALERAPAARTAFLAEACAGNPDLRCEVEELLRFDDEAETFMQNNAAAAVAQQLDSEELQETPTLLTGQQLGAYKILALLGKGGMGEVHLALDTRLERKVALKLLPRDVAANKERLRRFVREAKAASALNHPHVATVYEIGAADGVSFIAMEYVEGQTLAAKINGAPLAIQEVVTIGSQIADALDEAHRNGITHRDLKPANVMLTLRDQVKVLDFGLAKITRPPSIESNVSTLKQTTPGVVMGTVPYMSPEQALGRDVDHRSDIFSLGVVLYEMATGKLPFAGANTVETLDRILHVATGSDGAVQFDVPVELERIVRKCLEKEREQRYQSARELLVDLKNLQRDSASTAPPAAQAVGLASQFKRHQRSAFIVLAALLLAGISYFVLRSPLPPKVAAYAQITRDGLPKGASGIDALVTDGSRLYFSERLSELMGLAQVSVTGGETVAIPAPLPDARLKDISPNRSELLVDSGVGIVFEAPLWVVPVLGGAPRRIGEVMGHAATWTPDGQQIVYANGSTLYLAKSDGTESRKLATVTGRPLWPRWSPDGSRLRFTVWDTAFGGVSSLWEVNADGSNLHLLLPHWNKPANECCGNWTVDGRYFVFQSTRNGTTNIWAKREQAGLFQRASQEPVQLTFGPLNYTRPVPSLDGKKLFVVGEQRRGELARYDTKTQQWGSYLSGISAEHLDFSRDGAWVVYVDYPESNLWRSKVDGSERLQLTYPPLQASAPRWSPDGRQIAFSGGVPGKPGKAYLVAAEGGTPQRLTQEERTEGDLGWSSDGKTLVFSDFEAKLIYLLDLSTRQVSKLPGSEGLFSPRWSPDGRYIAAREAVSQGKLMLFDLTTQKWMELAQQPASWPRWSRDGKFIYFSSRIQNDPVLLRVGIADRKIERLASLKNFRVPIGIAGPWIGWTPDDAPLALRDIGTQEIYALDWQAP